MRRIDPGYGAALFAPSLECRQHQAYLAHALKLRHQFDHGTRRPSAAGKLLIQYGEVSGPGWHLGGLATTPEQPGTVEQVIEGGSRLHECHDEKG